MFADADPGVGVGVDVGAVTSDGTDVDADADTGVGVGVHVGAFTSDGTDVDADADTGGKSDDKSKSDVFGGVVKRKLLRNHWDFSDENWNCVIKRRITSGVGVGVEVGAVTSDGTDVE